MDPVLAGLEKLRQQHGITAGEAEQSAPTTQEEVAAVSEPTAAPEPAPAPAPAGTDQLAIIMAHLDDIRSALPKDPREEALEQLELNQQAVLEAVTAAFERKREAEAAAKAKDRQDKAAAAAAAALKSLGLAEAEEPTPAPAAEAEEETAGEEPAGVRRVVPGVPEAETAEERVARLRRPVPAPGPAPAESPNGEQPKGWRGVLARLGS